MPRRPGGFTLLELMILIGVIAIFAVIALPSYNAYVTRSKLREAQTGLATYYVRMEQFFQDNRNYGSGHCAVAPPSGTVAKNFSFSCALNGTGYIAKAVGMPELSTQGFTFTVDEVNTRRTTAVPSGWTLPTDNCWITNKEGACS